MALYRVSTETAALKSSPLASPDARVEHDEYRSEFVDSGDRCPAFRVGKDQPFPGTEPIEPATLAPPVAQLRRQRRSEAFGASRRRVCGDAGAGCDLFKRPQMVSQHLAEFEPRVGGTVYRLASCRAGKGASKQPVNIAGFHQLAETSYE